MAFVRKKVKTFKWPVEVKEPSDSKPGEFETSEFTAVFKRVKISELKKLDEEQGVELLKKVMVGWESVTDEAGKDIKFSLSELEDFADNIDWLKSVLAAYTKTYAEAESGN